MPELTIDGQQIEVPAGSTLLEAAQLLGVHIPRFCHHPALPPAGSCRMCLVELEGAPKLVPACSTAAADGMRVLTASDRVKAARRENLEFLLLNHPLDCPICDQAGECGLQDYYMEHSLAKSRFPAADKTRRAKRRAVGPHIVLDNERCILCTRCVRFCAEVTKTSELEVMKRGAESFVDCKEGRPVDNGYTLNLADLCPVGAITSRDFRFKQRVWFLKKTPTICLGCATGCLIEAHHNENEIYRLVPRPNAETNTWLCDAGRMTYKAAQAGDRLVKALIRKGLIDVEPALREAATRIDEAKASAAVLGSPWLSVEDNAALGRLAREAFKTENFCFDFKAEQGIKDGILVNKDPAPNTAGIGTVRGSYGGLDLEEFRRRLASGRIKALVAEARAFALVKQAAAEGGTRLVIFALNRGETPPSAQAVLPYASYFETAGTFINYQGLIRRTEPAVEPPAGVKPLWAMVNRLAAYSGAAMHINSPAEALKGMNQ